jgi:hypothetical protein
VERELTYALRLDPGEALNRLSPAFQRAMRRSQKLGVLVRESDNFSAFHWICTGACLRPCVCWLRSIKKK